MASEHAHDAHHEDGEVHVHAVPARVLLGTFGGLILFTFLTVWVTRFDVGAFDVVVAMAIALVKATLVAVYFMHLKYDKLLNSILLVISVLFLLLFVVIATLDTREYQGTLDPPPASVPAVEATAGGGH